jgi:multidrug efflux pump subunit AcrB
VNLTEFSLKRPHTVLAMVLVVAVLGLAAMFRMATDLFPDMVPPQVAVLTVRPGASAEDMTDAVTRVLEKELSTLAGIVKVSSTTRDEVSSINVEFDYGKPVGEAVLDAQNAIGRVRALLPTDTREPRIYRITDSTRSLMTLAISPLADSAKTLADIRLLAENDLKDALLSLPGIADVEVFGGHAAEVQVRAKRDRLAAQGLTLEDLAGALARQNVAVPAGTIYAGRQELLVTTVGEFADLEDIRALPLRAVARGGLRVGDVAEVNLAEAPSRSQYHGNGRPAIAVNVMRAQGGAAVPAIRAVKDALPRLMAQYPDLRFEITDDQQPLIDLNVRGMRGSLVQAILITVCVILVFLGDRRVAAVVATSIPLSFLGAVLVLQASPYTLNMVTLSGLIIAVGMVVDASVVVLENIHRHWREGGTDSAATVALRGTREIALEISAGMFTTVAVLIPVMATDGYTGQVMRPLNLMVIASLVASLLVALTLVPLLASRTLTRRQPQRNLIRRTFERFDAAIGRMADAYSRLTALALRHRRVTLSLCAVLFVGTMRTIPALIGGELMPAMDTGITLIEFETPTDASPEEAARILAKVESILREAEGVVTLSATLGSEAGTLSFGGGGATAQTGRITVRLVDRTRRAATIWALQDGWRDQLRRVSGIRTLRISEFGATPMSTTKAPLDVIVSGPDARIVSEIGDRCFAALQGLPGLFDLRRSWAFDKAERRVTVDPVLARAHGTTTAAVAESLRMAVSGATVTRLRLDGQLDIPVTVQYAAADIGDERSLTSIYVPTAGGPVPLRALAKVQTRVVAPITTREHLRRTLDITGVNRGPTIKHLAAAARKRLAGLSVPEGYRIEVGGSTTDMALAQRRFGRALLIGLVLLYVLLASMLKSWRHPVTVLSAIPLAVASGLWGLMLFHKPMCQPAMMGFILLGGTVINNAILLLGFVETARAEGMPRDEALVQSVQRRMRPILITTVSTILGLAPLILEQAVGLERMSPLGIVAAVGLLVGTVLTLVVVPTVYAALDSLGARRAAAAP